MSFHWPFIRGMFLCHPPKTKVILMSWKGLVSDSLSKFIHLAGKISFEDKQSLLVASRWKTHFPLFSFRFASFLCRKNPTHFEEYSHDKEDDKTDNNVSNVRSDGAADDRPECAYGTSCYRKNAQHKRNYKHTKALGMCFLFFSLTCLFVVVVLSSLFSYPDLYTRKRSGWEAFLFI